MVCVHNNRSTPLITQFESNIPVSSNTLENSDARRFKLAIQGNTASYTELIQVPLSWVPVALQRTGTEVPKIEPPTLESNND